jgi:DNA-binding SARP family transcriptional activator
MGELVSVLWEGRPDTASLRSQLRSLITDLRATLRSLGAEKVVIKGRDYIAVDPARVDCDYYRYLAGEKAARSVFRGEYMSNYSWAEITVGSLQQKK